jgi:ArsR family transcriptional regulator
MDSTTKARFQARAKILKAMAHASRLFILNELTKGECCVCDLTELVGADNSTVSKHLSVLREAGLVSSEKRGSQVFYQLSCSCINPFFDCIESVIKSNKNQQNENSRCCR